MTPLITVIIPCYNGAKYVHRCLDSIRRQSFRDLEVLLIDDGSTDDSVALAAEYTEVTVISNDSNRGLAYTRNRGIQLAHGRYVHFLDVDDRVSSDYYLRMAESAQATGADIVIGGAVFQGRYYHNQRFSQIKTYTGRSKYCITYPGRWGYSVLYLFRTSLLREHRITFPEGRLMEDIPFTIRAFYYADAVSTAIDAEYLYIRNEGSILTTRDEAHKLRRRRDRQLSREEVRRFAEEKGVRIPGVNGGFLRFGLEYLRRRLFASRQTDLTEELKQ